VSVNDASRWSPADYASNAAFVPALGAAALELLAPQPGELILDLGCGNIATLRGAIRAELVDRGYPVPAQDPQWYPDVEAFTAVYAEAGFERIEARLIPRETPLPAGIARWVLTFRGGWLDVAGVPAGERADVAAAVERRLSSQLRKPDGSWFADYVRLRFSMRKPH